MNDHEWPWMTTNDHEWKSGKKLIINQNKNNNKKNIAVNLMGNIKRIILIKILERTVALIQ